MTQTERRQFLIRALLAESPRYRDMAIPADAQGQRELLRALMNVREPAPVGAEFLAVQDAYLAQRLRERGVTDAEALPELCPQISLWRGDITLLGADAIVNAANSGMTGCYAPLHGCIDNQIHTYAGVELRLACAELMERQGHPEPTGRAKITRGYCLPSRYVLHTVGPIVNGPLTKKQERQLASCYEACLALAAEHGLRTVAFCCISTGVFGFPKRRAAEIATETVRGFLTEHPGMRVIFNVFLAEDEAIYREILTEEDA